MNRQFLIRPVARMQRLGRRSPWAGPKLCGRRLCHPACRRRHRTWSTWEEPAAVRLTPCSWWAAPSVSRRLVSVPGLNFHKSEEKLVSMSSAFSDWLSEKQLLLCRFRCPVEMAAYLKLHSVRSRQVKDGVVVSFEVQRSHLWGHVERRGSICRAPVTSWPTETHQQDTVNHLQSQTKSLALVEAVFTSHANPKYFIFHPSHQIFRRIHEVLNVGKK
jgi:hypothetical protein